MERRLIPVSCTLPTEDARTQADEWVDLVRNATEVRRTEMGASLALPANLFDAASDLAKREAQCCSFLQFELSEVADEAFTLTVLTETADGVEAINSILHPS